MSRRRDYRLEGGGNSQSKADQTFFRPGQWVVQQERDILRPQVLQMCQGFRLQSAFLAALKAATVQTTARITLIPSPIGS